MLERVQEPSVSDSKGESALLLESSRLLREGTPLVFSFRVILEGCSRLAEFQSELGSEENTLKGNSEFYTTVLLWLLSQLTHPLKTET